MIYFVFNSTGEVIPNGYHYAILGISSIEDALTCALIDMPSYIGDGVYNVFVRDQAGVYEYYTTITFRRDK